MSQCSQREARPSSLARLTPWVESRFGPRSEPGQVSEVPCSQAIWNGDRSGSKSGGSQKQHN